MMPGPLAQVQRGHAGNGSRGDVTAPFNHEAGRALSPRSHRPDATEHDVGAFFDGLVPY